MRDTSQTRGRNPYMRYIRWKLNRDSMLVRGDTKQLRNTHILIGVRVALTLVALVGFGASLPPGQLVWGIAVGCLSMLGLGEAITRSRAYRGGWLKGRSELMASVDEASRRGLGLDEWATAEVDRESRIIW